MTRTLVLALAFATTVSAQPVTRRATNIAALVAYPGFFHVRPIVIVGTVTTRDNGEVRVSDDAGSMRVVFKGNAPDGLDEIRGEFWDLGQMKADEPRLSTIDLQATFHIDPNGPWPRSGGVTAIMATAITPATHPPAPTIRAIVLNPSRYVDQRVTVTGQFAGRNLLGDLPDAPAKSRYDFVIRSADAAMWVSGARPRGKGFDLAVDARIDTGRWLEVSGVVREGRGLQWLEVGPEAIQLGKAPTDTTSAQEESSVRVPAGPPPEVIFSAPTEAETDVASTTNVRIQFSRDLDPATIKGHVRAGYIESQPAAPAAPAIDFTTQYNGANRVLEVRFVKPLERFRTLKLELLEGILGTDWQPLKPWTLTFALGGS